MDTKLVNAYYMSKNEDPTSKNIHTIGRVADAVGTSAIGVGGVISGMQAVKHLTGLSIGHGGKLKQMAALGLTGIGAVGGGAIASLGYADLKKRIKELRK